MSTPELRKLYREHHERHHRIFEEWGESGYQYPPPNYPPYPDELRSIACGARTRAGTPCKLTSIYINGRCKFHGGLSTGPRTQKGKKRSAANGFKPKTCRNVSKVGKSKRHEPHV